MCRNNNIIFDDFILTEFIHSALLRAWFFIYTLVWLYTSSSTQLTLMRMHLSNSTLDVTHKVMLATGQDRMV